MNLSRMPGLPPADVAAVEGMTRAERRWLRRKTMVQVHDVLLQPLLAKRDPESARFWISAAILFAATELRHSVEAGQDRSGR